MNDGTFEPFIQISEELSSSTELFASWLMMRLLATREPILSAEYDEYVRLLYGRPAIARDTWTKALNALFGPAIPVWAEGKTQRARFVPFVPAPDLFTT